MSETTKTKKMMGETEHRIFLILFVVLSVADLTMLINLLVR